MPELGKWGVVDMLSEKYVGLSPYAYVANSPIKLSDPDGRDIVVKYKEEKKDKEGNVKYDKHGNVKMRNRSVMLSLDKDGNVQAKKGGKMVANSFVSNVVSALNYVKKGDKSDVIGHAMKSDVSFRVKAGNESRGDNDGFDRRSNTIRWDPLSGLQTGDDSGIGTGKVQSPALGLLHELGHGVDKVYNHTDYVNRRKKDAGIYTNEEEWFVINAYENVAARVLGEPTRSNHYGEGTPMPTTTSHKE